MADKILTLVQDKTGDNIYPNIKKENLPIDLYTTAQRQALNSGITSEKVTKYDTYETSKVNKADVGSVVTNLIQQKEGGILSIAGAVLTNADGKLIKGPISQDVYSKDKVDELVGSASGGSELVLLEVTREGKITYTKEQYETIKKNKLVSFLSNGQQIFQVTNMYMPGDALALTYTLAQPRSDNSMQIMLYIAYLTKTETTNTIDIQSAAFESYSITELNETSIPKVWQCVNGNMSWEELPSSKQYFNHDIVIMFNDSPLNINIIHTSNKPIDSITDLKAACGSRTQVMMTGVFRDDNYIRIVTMYNPQTNKIWVTTSDGTGQFITEILLASSANYVLGDIVDNITTL